MIMSNIIDLYCKGKRYSLFIRNQHHRFSNGDMSILDIGYRSIRGLKEWRFTLIGFQLVLMKHSKRNEA